MLDPFLPEKPEDVERLHKHPARNSRGLYRAGEGAARRASSTAVKPPCFPGNFGPAGGAWNSAWSTPSATCAGAARALWREGAHAAHCRARIVRPEQAGGSWQRAGFAVGGAEPCRRPGCDARGARALGAVRTVEDRGFRRGPCLACHPHRLDARRARRCRRDEADQPGMAARQCRARRGTPGAGDRSGARAAADAAARSTHRRIPAAALIFKGLSFRGAPKPRAGIQSDSNRSSCGLGFRARRLRRPE